MSNDTRVGAGGSVAKFQTELLSKPGYKQERALPRLSAPGIADVSQQQRKAMSPGTSGIAVATLPRKSQAQQTYASPQSRMSARLTTLQQQCGKNGFTHADILPSMMAEAGSQMLVFGNSTATRTAQLGMVMNALANDKDGQLNAKLVLEYAPQQDLIDMAAAAASRDVNAAGHASLQAAASSILKYRSAEAAKEAQRSFVPRDIYAEQKARAFESGFTVVDKKLVASTTLTYALNEYQSLGPQKLKEARDELAAVQPLHSRALAKLRGALHKAQASGNKSAISAAEIALRTFRTGPLEKQFVAAQKKLDTTLAAPMRFSELRNQLSKPECDFLDNLTALSSVHAELKKSTLWTKELQGLAITNSTVGDLGSMCGTLLQRLQGLPNPEAIKHAQGAAGDGLTAGASRRSFVRALSEPVAVLDLRIKNFEEAISRLQVIEKSATGPIKADAIKLRTALEGLLNQCVRADGLGDQIRSRAADAQANPKLTAGALLAAAGEPLLVAAK